MSFRNLWGKVGSDPGVADMPPPGLLMCLKEDPIMSKRKGGTTMVFKGKAALAVLNALSGREVVLPPYSPAMCPHGVKWGFGDCAECDAKSVPTKGSTMDHGGGPFDKDGNEGPNTLPPKGIEAPACRECGHPIDFHDKGFSRDAQALNTLPPKGADHE